MSINGGLHVGERDTETDTARAVELEKAVLLLQDQMQAMSGALATVLAGTRALRGENAALRKQLGQEQPRVEQPMRPSSLVGDAPDAAQRVTVADQQ